MQSNANHYFARCECFKLTGNKFSILIDETTVANSIAYSSSEAAQSGMQAILEDASGGEHTVEVTAQTESVI
jgi:hypothetical protein